MGGRAHRPTVIGGGRDDRIVVWKFGGTSVADPGRLRAVAERMVRAQRSGRRVVAVLSAMGSSTDELVKRAHVMSARPRRRELDTLLSAGGRMSCALASMAVHELGCRAVSLTCAQAGAYTDETCGNARVRAARPDRIRAGVESGAIVLITGFPGMGDAGDVPTLGRCGSDASAVAVAAGLGLSECEIFTDVAGVYTADPRVVPDAVKLSSLRHDEMLEMAEAGADVLQPRSVELAAALGVDIRVRSSFSGERGTWIRRAEDGFEGDSVVGVAHRRHEPLFAVPGVSAAAVVGALARGGAALGTLIVGADEVRFSAPGVNPAEVSAVLGEIGAPVEIDQDLGTVSVVSMGMTRKPEVAATALAALAGADIRPRFVTTTPGRISVHIASDRIDDAVRALHQRFIPTTDPDQPASSVAG